MFGYGILFVLLSNAFHKNFNRFFQKKHKYLALTLFYSIKINLECMQNILWFLFLNHTNSSLLFSRNKRMMKQFMEYRDRADSQEVYVLYSNISTPSPLIIIQLITSQNIFYFQYKKKQNKIWFWEYRNLRNCSFNTLMPLNCERFNIIVWFVLV